MLADWIGSRARSSSVPSRFVRVEIPIGDWRGRRGIYVHGPDGALVELSERPTAR
jgi:hypothetical protein